MYLPDMEYEELIRCFDNPVRRKVLSALVDDGPMTPRMLLQTLHSTSQATLYRAISSMEAEGLIKVVSEEKKRAVTEKTYGPSGEYDGLKEAIIRDNNGPAYSAFIGWYMHRLFSQFRRYGERQDIDIAKDASGLFEGTVCIDQADLENFFRDIAEVCSKYSMKGEGDGKHEHTVGVIVAPPGEMS